MVQVDVPSRILLRPFALKRSLNAKVAKDFAKVRQVHTLTLLPFLSLFMICAKYSPEKVGC